MYKQKQKLQKRLELCEYTDLLMFEIRFPKSGIIFIVILNNITGFLGLFQEPYSQSHN